MTWNVSDFRIKFNIPYGLRCQSRYGAIKIPFDNTDDSENYIWLYREANSTDTPYQYMDYHWGFHLLLEEEQSYDTSTMLSSGYVDVNGETGYQITYLQKYSPYGCDEQYPKPDEWKYSVTRTIAVRHGGCMYRIVCSHEGYDFTEEQSKALDMICSTLTFY